MGIPRARLFPDGDVTPLFGVNRFFGSSFSLVPTLGTTATPTPTFLPAVLPDGLFAVPLVNSSVPSSGFGTSDSIVTVTSFLFSSS